MRATAQIFPRLTTLALPERPRARYCTSAHPADRVSARISHGELVRGTAAAHHEREIGFLERDAAHCALALRRGLVDDATHRDLAAGRPPRHHLEAVHEIALGGLL